MQQEELQRWLKTSREVVQGPMIRSRDLVVAFISEARGAIMRDSAAAVQPSPMITSTPHRRNRWY
jgi:hypothetical protein